MMINIYPTASNNNNKRKKKKKKVGDGGKVIPPGNRKQYLRFYFFLVVLFTILIIFNNERLLNPTMEYYKDSELGSSPSLSSFSSLLSPIGKNNNITVINVGVDVDGSDNTSKEWGNSSSSLPLSSSLSSSSSVDRVVKNIMVGSASDIVISNNDEEKQNNDGDDGDDDDDRPWLILHVGPPKTATTTIQHSFEKIAVQLAQDDNYYYMGQTLRTKESERIKSLGTPTMNEKANITIFGMNHFIYSHSKEFLDTLQYYHDNKRNVIISSEFYTSQLLHLQGSFDKIFNEIFLRKNNTRQQQQQQQQDSATAEKLFGFKIKIVVGYRHFFEWLPSYYDQRHLVSKKDTPNKDTEISNDTTLLYPYEGYIPGIIAYVEWFLRDLVQYDPVEDDKNNTNTNTNNNTNNNNKRNNINNTSYDGKFFSSHKKEAQKKVHGSIYSYLMWSSQLGLYDRVEIFDMHQQEYKINNSSSMTPNNEPVQQNLFANFVCQMLPSATNTCRHLVEQTEDEEFRKRIRRPRSHNLLMKDDMFRIIQATRMKKLSLTPEFKSSHHVTIPTGQKIKNGIQRWLNINNKMYEHHELKRCLKSESTQKLKVASWNFLLQQVLLVRHNKSRRKQSNTHLIELSSTKTDHLILSSQYPTRDDDDNNNNNNNNNKNGDDDDDSWIIQIKTEHDKSFNEYVSTGAFCEVDIEKLFSNEEFLNTVIFPPREGGTVISSF